MAGQLGRVGLRERRRELRRLPRHRLVVLLAIDKRDEYQLVQFILRFKGTQFIAGIVAGLVGAGQFFACVVLADREGEHACAERGPGAGESFPAMAALFVTHVAFTWLAFLLLPCSVRKGQRRTLTGAAAESRFEWERGGHLRHLLFWDVGCFVACAGLLVGCFLAQQLPVLSDDWRVRASLCWAGLQKLTPDTPERCPSQGKLQGKIRIAGVPGVLFCSPGTGISLARSSPPRLDRTFSRNATSPRGAKVLGEDSVLTVGGPVLRVHAAGRGRGADARARDRVQPFGPKTNIAGLK